MMPAPIPTAGPEGPALPDGPTAGPEGPALPDGPEGPALQGPPLQQPPSGGRLALAIGGALLVAAAVLVVAVLPAEYGIDPLGTGRALGLLDLYDADAGGSNAPPIAPASDAPPMATYKVDSVVFTLRPSEGFEYKYRIERGGGLVYAWTATRAVNYEFHGEHDGARAGTAVSYEKAAGDRRSGSFTAPASGIHGWYWENPGDEDMTITITSAGFCNWADEFRQRFDPVKHKGVVDRIRHELSAPQAPSARAERPNPQAPPPTTPRPSSR